LYYSKEKEKVKKQSDDVEKEGGEQFDDIQQTCGEVKTKYIQ
jgi:hypothetical protein